MICVGSAGLQFLRLQPATIELAIESFHYNRKLSFRGASTNPIMLPVPRERCCCARHRAPIRSRSEVEVSA